MTDNQNQPNRTATQVVTYPEGPIPRAMRETILAGAQSERRQMRSLGEPLDAIAAARLTRHEKQRDQAAEAAAWPQRGIRDW